MTDSLPESLILPEPSERRTVELCADELRPGVRCILLRGHDGEHEGQPLESEQRVTWRR